MWRKKRENHIAIQTAQRLAWDAGKGFMLGTTASNRLKPMFNRYRFRQQSLITRLMLDRANSPKLTAATRRASIYPYYAGFSEQFVESIIREVGISQNDVVLDPWNGSGTTTSVCSRSAIPSIGIDINPAMKPIAYVRSMSADDVQRVCDHAISALDTFDPRAKTTTPFSFCFDVFKTAKASCPQELHDGLRFGFMVACRTLARKVRSKNPTWHSLKALQALEISPEITRAEAISSFTALAAWKNSDPIDFDKKVTPELITGDWDHLRRHHSATHVITSPPYLTRIDYVMKTLPEILFLNEENSINLLSLRGRMLGSVLTKKGGKRKPILCSKTANITLSYIKTHESKASSTYYHRFFRQYLRRLESSLHRISNLAPSPQTITIVSQGSYYKEIFVDLPAIIDDILNLNGYQRYAASTFSAAAHMAMVNRRSKASLLPSPLETAAIYRKA